MIFVQFVSLYRLFLCNLTDEAIAATMRSFNEARRLWVVPKSFPQLTNGNFEDCFTHERSRPHSVEEFLFRDELSRTRNRILEYGKRFGSDLYFQCPIPQAFVSQVQAKGIKNNDVFFVRHRDYRNITAGL